MEAIAVQFLEQYYSAMMTNRPSLINFYNNNSTLTYGGSLYQGLEDIKDKI